MKANLEQTLTRGIEAIYPSRQAFEKAAKAKKLTIFFGIDPTAPSLHLGHLVVLRKLAKLQDFGHKIILLIGDFTARIGDPSQQLQARQPLLQGEVLKNAADYKNQAGKILKFTGSNPAEIKFNSTWLSKLTFEGVLKLMANFTAQQLLERDMFQKRIKAGKPISLPELVYPLLQGYDSVAMKVDCEIGGADQTFNMLVGRQLVKKYLEKEKFVITCKLLTVGVTKMGKTESIFIPLSLQPADMFGKIMALPDKAMPLFFELLTDFNLAKLAKIQPMEEKKLLATEVLKQLFSQREAADAQKEFERVFQKKEIPTQAQIFRPKVKTYELLDLLKESGTVHSAAEGKRLITSGATIVNGKKLTDPKVVIRAEKGTVVRVGKHRFFKIG